MLILRGAPALSPFRADKLAEKLSAIHPDIRLLDSQFVHFAELAEPLADGDDLRLQQLLGEASPDASAQPGPGAAEIAASTLLLVVPRPGTAKAKAQGAKGAGAQGGEKKKKKGPKKPAAKAEPLTQAQLDAQLDSYKGAAAMEA